MNHPLLQGRISFAVFIPALMFVSVVLSSCGSTRSLVYMQGKFDTAQLSKVTYKEPIIQKGDILSILVYSDNPEATKIYNQSLITTPGSSAAGGTQGLSELRPVLADSLSMRMAILNIRELACSTWTV
jgi:hypothetical protein